MMDREVTPAPTAAWALPTEAPHSFQLNRHVDGGKPRSGHAEKKGDARIMSQMARGGNNAREAAAKRWISDFEHLSSPKTKRQLSRPLDLPSLASPGTPPVANTNPQQQRHTQSKTNLRRSQSNVNNVPPPADKRPDYWDFRRSQTNGINKTPEDSDSVAQRTALQCVAHASKRQAAAKAAMTATAQISTTLRDLMGDSNRALAVARKTQIEAEVAAARAEGAAKKVKEVSDLAAKDIQRANLELEEANAQAEEAWEFLRRVKSVPSGLTKENDPFTINMSRALPIVGACAVSHETRRSTVANHSLSTGKKSDTHLFPSELREQRSDIRAGDHSVQENFSQSDILLPPQPFASADHDSLVATSLIEPTRHLKGHTSPITQVVTVDQNRFLSSSWDTTVRLWDADTGECIRTFRGHGDWVTDISVLDSKHFISGSDDRSVKMWNFDKEECIRTFTGHSSFVKSMAPIDSDRFLSGSRDRTVKLFSVSTGDCLQTFQGHTDVISAIVSLGSDRFASGSHDRNVKLWNVSSATCARTLVGHTGRIKTLAAISEHELISGSDDKTIRLWNVDSGRCIREFGSKNALVFSVIHVCEGFFLSCGGNNIKVYNIHTGKCVKSYETPRVSLAVARLSNERFVTGSDHMLHLWKF
ncbi:hypothetical protein ACHAW5_010698 [Stephanodiscus triporus]|uniref:Uncharacterized protein n=1 Tax=Stephanodiscus triporus TaxID=2934178 RepID=A0ABD3MI44_9STRA